MYWFTIVYVSGCRLWVSAFIIVSVHCRYLYLMCACVEIYRRFLRKFIKDLMYQYLVFRRINQLEICTSVVSDFPYFLKLVHYIYNNQFFFDELKIIFFLFASIIWFLFDFSLCRLCVVFTMITIIKIMNSLTFSVLGLCRAQNSKTNHVCKKWL